MAARYLHRRWFYVWKLNWRSRSGEIDIIAVQDKTLVFVEVKTRSESSAAACDPIDAVDEEKERHLRRTARSFIRSFQPEIRRRRVKGARFDIVAVIACRPRPFLPRRYTLIHLKDILEWE